MKNFKLLTCMVALLTAMSFIGCSNSTGGDNQTIPSGKYILEGNSELKTIDIQDGKLTFDGENITLSSDGSFTTSGGYTGKWIQKENKIIVTPDGSDYPMVFIKCESYTLPEGTYDQLGNDISWPTKITFTNGQFEFFGNDYKLSEYGYYTNSDNMIIGSWFPDSPSVIVMINNDNYANYSK